MITRTFTSLAVMTALGVFLPMSSSHAFGLGKIELSSALNQPFRAQIPVTALREEEKGNLQVQLASASEFERAGLNRSYYLTQFEFNIVEFNGVTSIDITSKNPVKEPFVDILLTATAGNGRLIREYTVLLDPPKDIFVKPQAKVETKVSKPAQTSTPKTSYTTTSSATSKYSSGSSYGPTDRTDTLWKIAVKTKQGDATVNQMMMALLDENPDAFTNNNINGLKAGYTLEIPAESKIKKLSKAEAISAVTQQNSFWKNRNLKPAPVATVETVTSVVETPTTQKSQDQVARPAADNEQIETAAETTARLKLVAPSEDVVSSDSELSPMGDDKLTVLSEQLTLAQETIETQTQENIDIKSRMAAMEEQIETLRRLLSLKDPDLALLQSTLEQQQATAASTDMATEAADDNNVTSNNSSDTVGAETDMLPADVVEQEVMSADSADTQDQMLDEMAQTEESATTEQSKAQEQESEQADAMDEALTSVGGAVSYVSDLAGLDQEQVKSKYEQVKSYISQHKQESTLGGLLLLLLIWLIIRFRNRPYLTWDQAVGDKTDKPSAVTESKRPQIVDNNDVVDTEPTPVDPIDEPEKSIEQLINDADVYVSYGDFAKANQTLKLAHDAEPMNVDVVHKLLFVLFKQTQINDFVELAKYYQKETSAPEWDEVLSWGQELAPQEAIFQPVLKNIPEETIQQDQTVQTIDTDVEAIEAVELDNVIPDLDASSNLNIDDELMAFNSDQEQTGSDVSSDLADELAETDLSDDDRLSLPEIEPLDIEQDENIDTASIASGSNTMEFDLDLNNDDEAFELDGLETVTDDDLTEANTALSDSELEFDLGDYDQVDEAETKLDLAAAYIDMGDPDGAKSILEEVLSEGNDDQKTRAETLLSGIK